MKDPFPHISSVSQHGATGRELDQLSRFAASLGATLDVDTLIDDAVEPLASMSNADRIAVAIAQSDARTLILRIDVQSLLATKTVSATPVASLGTETVVFDSRDTMPPQLKTRISDVSGPIAVVPLWAHAHLRGVIFLQRNAEGFALHMQKMLTTAGRQLALAVENSRLLSDLQESYRKLMDTQEDLIRAERLAALGQLSATMAHEIRNPLTTIFSALSQIRRHTDPSEMSQTLLDIAEEEALRLKRMVADLLKFARPQRPVLEEGNLLEAVRKVVDDIELTTAQTEHPVHVVLSDASCDVSVRFDFEHISRALQLLINNAVESYEDISIERRTDDHQVILTVKAYRDGAVITVRDQGVGIPAELIIKVFEPFFSTKPTGTGLGLSGARRIAEDHGGSLEMESLPGIGTTAKLFIQTKHYYSKHGK